MGWPEKTGPSTSAADKRTIGEGLFRRCDGCGAAMETATFAGNFEVCPRCSHHHRLPAADWQRLLCDDGQLVAWDEELRPTDPLAFDDGTRYADRLVTAARKSGAVEAIVTGEARIGTRAVGFGNFVFSFMGGSMGSVVGEKLARLFERAAARPMPVVLLQASGGARMQEGILSLMQMAKAVAALERLRRTGMPFISCLAHPTTGGVAASFAFLGDVNIGEPKALIGFAGPRVIENTIRQRLPDGFQRAEFLLEHGMLDMVCPRLELRERLLTLLRHLCPPSSARARAPSPAAPASSEIPSR